MLMIYECFSRKMDGDYSDPPTTAIAPGVFLHSDYLVLLSLVRVCVMCCIYMCVVRVFAIDATMPMIVFMTGN